MQLGHNTRGGEGARRQIRLKEYILNVAYLAKLGNLRVSSLTSIL